MLDSPLNIGYLVTCAGKFTCTMHCLGISELVKFCCHVLHCDARIIIILHVLNTAITTQLHRVALSQQHFSRSWMSASAWLGQIK